MIPIRLSLRNFMCYKDNVPEISFESIHTACISGNNGNGKSALIDAMTWALWGKTRANSDDDLIHTGQSETEVIFEFEVNDQLYRIIRKRAKPKRQKAAGQSLLEFQSITPQGNKILTGDTIDQTQQKIIEILHMDYETFINSAFLRQGHADEFTKKRPNERKQVLASILQLSVYDQLEARAKEKAKELSQKIGLIDAAVSGITEELARKTQYQDNFDQAQKELEQAEIVTREKENRLTGLRQQKELLENRKTELAALNSHVQDTRRNLARWSEQAEQHKNRIINYEKLISQKELIENNYNRFKTVDKSLQEFETKLHRISDLEKQKHKLDMDIAKAREDLNIQHSIISERISELEKSSRKLNALKDELKETTIKLEKFEESEKKLQEMRETSKTLHTQTHFLQAEIKRLTAQSKEIDEKLDMLSHTHGEGLTCPLCESELGEEGQQRIISKYRQEKSDSSNNILEYRNELSAKDAEAKKLDGDIQTYEGKIRRSIEILQSKKGNLEQSIADSGEAADKIEKDKISLQELEKKIAAGNFAVKEQTDLLQVNKEIEELGYDSEKHKNLRSQKAELAQYEEPFHKLDEAARLIGQEKELVDQANQNIVELETKIKDDSQKIELINAELDGLLKATAELSVSEKEYRDSLERQRSIRAALGACQANLDRLAELELKNAEKAKQRAEAEKEEAIYKDLTQAFGKKGLQAMLIDMALPEIENEANRLLSRMTDGRMSVKFETQRETKKGDIMETLDINISDELGTRNYEMFSGGEAFRINFAIRIALSRLLAHRAGAPLPTLIIDEGFGTQDSSGIEKIKEAITSIQDDFEKILVITHILDFKDAFPLRIEVVKSGDGSNIYLN